MSASAPPPGPSKFRRVVTTRTAQGSRVLIDGPGYNFGALHEMWMTDAGNHPVAGDPADPVERPFSIAPQPGGTVFRFVEIAPEASFDGMSEADRRAAVKRAFAAVGSADALVDTTRHPAMHQTETIDYIILLEGELTMLLDEGEVDLKPFDVVVQRGTNHAWVNKGSAPALVAAILAAPA